MRRVLQVLLPIVFLAAGLAVVGLLVASMSGAPKVEATLPSASVDVVTVHAETHHVSVTSSGTVEASGRVELVAQVAGRVVWVAKGLTPGMHFDKGDTIARIDARDYEAAVVQAEAAVQAREVELQLEESRARQATREAELLGTTPDSALARREPQLALAKANVMSAEAALTSARLNLERTRLTAPAHVIVTAESLEVGAYVAPGAPVATLIGVDRFRVRTSVPVRQMSWIEAPIDGVSETPGSTATIRQALGDGATLERVGFVLRQLGELDAESRTATVLVAIDDPLSMPDGKQPILPGAYVDVQIEGREATDIFEVPRVALVDGGFVWLASPEDTLVRRDVEIAWGTDAHVYIHTGLADGDRVVTTPLSLPIEGMPLDVSDALAGSR